LKNQEFPMNPLAKSVLVASVLVLSLGGVAHARDQVFSARLANPTAERVEIIAQDTLWRCEADSCQAVARHSPTVRACRQFVREAGPVVSYGPAGDELSADELARCNGAAAGATVTAQN
jgi:hypothetical protein